LRAVERALEHEKFQLLAREQAPMATIEMIALAHPREYVEQVREASPREGMVRLDADTTMSPGTFEAVMRAAGGACQAVDEVMEGKVTNAFVATRPPGHHAETATPMASACSTMRRSPRVMHRSSMAPSALRSSISTCITATAARTFSGAIRP